MRLPRNFPGRGRSPGRPLPARETRRRGAAGERALQGRVGSRAPGAARAPGCPPAGRPRTRRSARISIPVDWRPVRWTLRTSTPGFTLLELILVMTLLSIVMALAAPSLARFFRGRSLDVESQRLLALTRYGQSRAVSEGIPMVLWIDEDQRLYGLQAEFTYSMWDELAVEYALDDDVALEIGPAISGGFPATTTPPATTSAQALNAGRQLTRDMVFLRFTPDGFIGPSSPEWLELRERREEENGSALWVALSRNRLHYELRTNEPPPQVR